MIPQRTVLSLLLIGCSYAFMNGPTVEKSSISFCPVSTKTTALALDNTKQPPEIPAPQSLAYGEESRKYRRTVYTHDDWVKHRSPDRFIRNLKSTTSSGVYKNLGREIVWTVGVATFVFLWNLFLNGSGYEDLSGVKHTGSLLFGDAKVPFFLPVLGLPLTPFTLSSPSLGLLLVFRTNTAYQRWDEARKNWGMNINHTRDLCRMGTAYYGTHATAAPLNGIPTSTSSSPTDPVKKEDDLQRLALCTWAFVRAMKRHLSPTQEDEEDFKEELRAKLPKEPAEKIIAANHRPNRALFELSAAIENLDTDIWRKNEIHRAATIFEDTLGSSERLLSSPVPLFYSRHTARFLSFWLLLLPFALYQPFETTWNHVGMIPATAMISVFLFGIEELATQMEEPFTILPMQGFCNKIYDNCNEIVSWGTEVKTDGDNVNGVNGVNGVSTPQEAEKTYTFNSNIF